MDPLQQELVRRAMGDGNINVFSRPRSKNPDGSISTIYSTGVNPTGKQEVLVPGVDEHGKGIIPNAEDQYLDTGHYLGKFKPNPAGMAASDMLSDFLHREAASGLTTPPLASSRHEVDPEHLRQVLLYMMQR